jgi:hypothetical protein
MPQLSRLSGDVDLAAQAPADERVQKKVDADAVKKAGSSAIGRIAGADRAVDEEASRALVYAARGDQSAAQAHFGSKMVGKGTLAAVKERLVEREQFDTLPLWMQETLSPANPFHQAHEIDAQGGIYCTTAVRIEGVTATQALAALTGNWNHWWSSCKVSNWSADGPQWDFVPEHFFAHWIGSAAMAIDPFSLHVKMEAPISDGAGGYLLPAELSGAFAGNAQMRIEAVDGGVVVHDTWMGVALEDKMMSAAGGPAFWTDQHLKALVGGLGLGVGGSGLAGLRDYLLPKGAKRS